MVNVGVCVGVVCGMANTPKLIKHSKTFFVETQPRMDQFSFLFFHIFSTHMRPRRGAMMSPSEAREDSRAAELIRPAPQQ